MSNLKHKIKERLQKLTIEEVLEYIKKNPETQFFVSNGIQAKIKRAKTLAKIGLDCKHCNLKGQYFTIDVDVGGGIHLDLFSVNDKGQEVLMTIDHIIPKSKGGSNLYHNLQCLCMPCNSKKGDSNGV